MRKIALIITFLCIVGILHAQKVQLGLKFNPNLAWFKIDNKIQVENSSVGIGFSYGLMVDYHFLDNVALCIEPQHLLYNPSTIVTDSSNLNAKVNVKWKMQYIDIPLSLKMSTNQMGKFKYFGKIGFSTSIKTSAKINDNKSNSVFALDFSMLIGGGIHYYLGGNTALLLGATFHNGFVGLNKDNTVIDQKIPGITTVSLKGVNMKSQYISLDIGILF